MSKKKLNIKKVILSIVIVSIAIFSILDMTLSKSINLNEKEYTIQQKIGYSEFINTSNVTIKLVNFVQDRNSKNYINAEITNHNLNYDIECKFKTNLNKIFSKKIKIDSNKTIIEYFPVKLISGTSNIDFDYSCA